MKILLISLLLGVTGCPQQTVTACCEVSRRGSEPDKCPDGGTPFSLQLGGLVTSWCAGCEADELVTVIAGSGRQPLVCVR